MESSFVYQSWDETDTSITCLFQTGFHPFVEHLSWSQEEELYKMKKIQAVSITVNQLLWAVPNRINE